MQNKISKGLLDVSQAELRELFKPQSTPGGMTKFILILVGLLLTPVSLFGAISGFRRAHSRFMEGEAPRLYNLPPIVRLAMILGGILIWIAAFIGVQVLVRLILSFGGETVQENPSIVLIYLGVNIVLTAVVWVWYRRWAGGIRKFLSEKNRYGSARFATDKELEPYREPKGLYIGDGLYYDKQGMAISLASTRSGKGLFLILNNLLRPHLFNGSKVVLDIKGELSAVSARVNREAGKKVALLNPFDSLGMGGVSYNPLDCIKMDKMNIVDDIAMLAEAIIPPNPDSKDTHFEDKARGFLATMLLHLMTAIPKELRHLGTVWLWLRLDTEQWAVLLADMSLNDDPNVGEVVRAGANEIIGLMKASEREYGSIMSTAQKATTIYQSPTLREAMKSSDQFTAAELASGNVILYVICPPDKLLAYKGWLRLVITSLILSVVRNPVNDVLFLLDEAYSLSYLSIIDLAYGAFAGYGIKIWSIFQNIGQVQQLYGKNWEGFIANSSVRHAFSVQDLEGAEYFSKYFGQMSVPSYNEKGDITGATPRALINLDEIRTQSSDVIYTMIDSLPPARVRKNPYFEQGLDADPNPYYKPKRPNENGNEIPALSGGHSQQNIQTKSNKRGSRALARSRKDIACPDNNRASVPCGETVPSPSTLTPKIKNNGQAEKTDGDNESVAS